MGPLNDYYTCFPLSTSNITSYKFLFSKLKKKRKFPSIRKFIPFELKKRKGKIGGKDYADSKQASKQADLMKKDSTWLQKITHVINIAS